MASTCNERIKHCKSKSTEERCEVAIDDRPEAQHYGQSRPRPLTRWLLACCHRLRPDGRPSMRRGSAVPLLHAVSVALLQCCREKGNC
eukprot:9491300-Pyramimonas_sp.AAC.1